MRQRSSGAPVRKARGLAPARRRRSCPAARCPGRRPASATPGRGVDAESGAGRQATWASTHPRAGPGQPHGPGMTQTWQWRTGSARCRGRQRSPGGCSRGCAPVTPQAFSGEGQRGEPPGTLPTQPGPDLACGSLRPPCCGTRRVHPPADSPLPCLPHLRIGSLLWISPRGCWLLPFPFP